jgi:hypothetical protein
VTDPLDLDAIRARLTSGPFAAGAPITAGFAERAVADIKALLAEVERLRADADRRVWRAINVLRGRCRWCSVVVDTWALSPGKALGPHRSCCRFYVGPILHHWERSDPNFTFGGTDYTCTCGRSVRHYSGSPGPVCPNLDETERVLTEPTYYEVDPPQRPPVLSAVSVDLDTEEHRD